MYDILNLYEEYYDSKNPLVCLDEKPKQLLKDKRKSIPMKPGNPEKCDYEYVGNGTANVFMAVEFKAGKGVTQITERRTMKDFAQFVKILVNENYSEAEVIRLLRVISISIRKSHSTKHSAKRKQSGSWTR
ncbi:Mobile element protein [Methanosarcina sp. WWM596]|nr:Mobile element protein [Methanosarcina sp. WWM596]AKB21242.1 Mobile element protein [Methanosarcina sp. WH1]